MKNRIVLSSVVTVAVVGAAGLGIRAFADHRDHNITLRAELRGLNEVPPTTSATGSNANISGRRSDFFDATELAATGARGGSADGLASGLRSTGATFDSGSASSPVPEPLASCRRRARR